MMRVVYFSASYGVHDRRFLEALARARVEVYFLRLGGPRRKGMEVALPAGVRRLTWPGGKETTWPTWAPLVAARLRATLARVRPDVVHAGPVQPCALPAAMADQRPLVTMSWGFDLLMDARSGAGRRAARRALAGTTVLFCDCEAVKRAAIELGMPPDRITVFPWGVDLRQFRPGRSASVRRALGWGSAFILMATRAWEGRYGIDVLLEGFAQAAAQEPQLRLLLLGDGPLRRSVLARVDDPRLRSLVHLPGIVDPDWLLAFYRAADLYVSTSHVDGTSVSLLEAMACGLPVIVSDIPGNTEWVQSGVHGWTFPDGDPRALAEAILQAARSRALRAMGARNRRQVERRADWSRAPRIMLAAYRRAARLALERA